jgi:hypothetical protein
VDTLDSQKRAVFACMRAHLSSTDSERIMRARLHACLTGSGVLFFPEVRLAFHPDTKAGHIDFLSELGYAVLIVGQRDALDDVFLRVRTIAADERVKQLLVITTRAQHRKLPGGVCDKPVDVFWIGGVS